MNDAPAPDLTTWRIEPDRSELRFTARRMGMVVRGRFTDIDGTLGLDLDHLERSSADVSVATASVEPAMPALRGLFLSDSFLAADEHPTLRFRSTAIAAADGRFAIDGELTFRGEVRPATLDAGLQHVDATGDARSVVISASGRVDRLMSDEELEIVLSLVAVPATAAADTSLAEPDAGAPPPTSTLTAVGGPAAADLPTGDDGRPIHVVAIVGSLRRASLNRSLVEAARAVAPGRMTVEILPLRDVPFYDGDVEAYGDPAAVRALKAAVRRADALIIGTPEYNRGLPAVTKNAIDWASRPAFDSALRGKPVLLMGASTGRSAAKYALEGAAATLDYAQARPFERRFGVARAADLIDDDGRFIDPPTLDALRDVLIAFRRFVLTADAVHAVAA